VIATELCKVHKYPDHKIADFGCGEGKLQLKLEESGHKRENLWSFDAGKLESGTEHVTQCDIASVPLPPNHLDVGVFCLSLMGTNFPQFLAEANRVLKIDGLLFVAEVLSRFEDIKAFTGKHMPQLAGFKCLKQTILNDFFYVLVFQKIMTTNRIEAK
jgi:ribosomal RNA-processing protein 8